MNSLLQTIIIAGAILASTYFLSTRPVTIKDASTNTTQGGVIMNSIAVMGEGKVFAKPDVFMLGVSISTVENTTAQAQEKIKTDVDALLELAKTAGVKTEDIQTTTMQIYPEYDYNNGTNTIKGYRATHGLTLKMRDLKQVDAFIPQITFSNNVQIDTMSYDIDDKTKLYSEARKLGFAKAKQKAEEMAGLAGVALGIPLSISDQIGYNYPTPMPMQANFYKAEGIADASGTPSTVNPGQLELSVIVNIVYGIQ